MILKPIIDKPAYWKSIFREIDDFLCGVLFDFPFAVLKQPVDNAKSLIEIALKSGAIEYVDGWFLLRKNINSRTAKQIEQLGGRYSKSKKGYKISPKNLSTKVLNTISTVAIANMTKVQQIEDYYKQVAENIEYIVSTFSVEKHVEKIEKDLHGQLKESLKQIHAIPSELSEEQKANIAQKYTNNLNYYITKFVMKEVPIMRKGIQDIVSQGYRANIVKKFLVDRYGVSVRKAEFLAKQETSLFVAHYREERFKEAGVNMYIWSSMEDSRVRPRHAHLNDTIWSWDNPPEAGEHGERLNPGQDFGCRCIALPYVPDEDLYPVKANLTTAQKTGIKEKEG